MMKRLIARTWKRCRSALTGRFVSAAAATAGPGGTVCETVARDEGDNL
jgi:regulator of RNase E activity RraA